MSDTVPILPALENALDELRAAYNDSAFIVHMETITAARAALDALRGLPDVRTDRLPDRRAIVVGVIAEDERMFYQAGQSDLARALRERLEGTA